MFFRIFKYVVEELYMERLLNLRDFSTKKKFIFSLLFGLIGLVLVLAILSNSLTATEPFGNSLNTNHSESGSVTQEEAIETSRNSPTMQKYIENATGYFLVEAEHLNVTTVKSMKENNPKYYGNLPDDHGVWKIVWGFLPKPYGIDYTELYQYMDEETGEILQELRGVIYL